MIYFLLILYFIIAAWLVPRIGFIKKSGLTPVSIRILFVIKVFTGFALGWISLHYFGHKPSDNDYWKMNGEGWQEYQLLLHHPKEYFSNLFSSPYSTGYSGFFNSLQSYWNDLRTNLVIKMISIFDIFSRGNYYINSLFINFIGFFGHIALFRFFSRLFQNRRNELLIGCFLLPSMLYFSSGLHKDAIVFTALAIFLYLFQHLVYEPGFSIKRLIILILSLAALLLIRSYIFILLIPACLAFYMCTKTKWPVLVSFISVYLICGLLFFTINRIVPGIDPPGAVVQKQHDFATTGFAKTAVSLDSLEPGFVSFAKNAPQALNHVVFRPYITEHPSFFLLPMSVELLIYEILFLLFLFFPKREPGKLKQAFILLGISLSLTAFLNIGYIVNNLGAIVRYRSLFLPFLIVPVLAHVNWEKLRHILKRKT